MKNLQKIFYGLALLFIPLAIILDKIGGVPQPLLFFLAAVAIFPLAALLVHATEQLATYTGDTIGGLLNATFGNAPELIIALVALKAGLYDMVKASIVGAILANMLLGLGAAFFAGGLKRHVQEFNPAAARNYMTMMLLAVISLAIPSTFHNFVTADTIKHEQYDVMLAVVGGAAESSSTVVMGVKNRMDLSVSIAIGSSIQMALCVAPVLVLASYFMALQPLNLVFSRGLLGAVFLTVLIGVMVAGDGKANWFKGVQLLTVSILSG